MIKINLTKNYAGFHVEGTYEDFDELYDSIFYFVGHEEDKNDAERDMKFHILGFLYDLRHAYQGDRYIYAYDNNLPDHLKKENGIKKSVKQNIMYGFDYVLPDLLLDYLIFEYFAFNKKKNEVSVMCKEWNIVNVFFSKVFASLSEILTKKQFEKCKKYFYESVISEKYFLKQWYMTLAIDYLSLDKEKRKKKINKIIDAICNWHLYEDYIDLQITIENYAKENNCSPSDIGVGEYPDFEW